MPTNNRRRFVGRAIQYFLRQDYPDKELIIVDDGDDPVSDLVPDDERIRYVRLSAKASVGAKRNLACASARGTIVAHWDDDDWQAPHRLRYQVGAMADANVDVCGINRLLFYDLRSGRAWRYAYPATAQLWLSGSSLCYRRDFWSAHRFADLSVGEDALFVWSGRPERMHVLDDDSFHVGVIHEHNISPKRVDDAYWQPYPVDRLYRLLGADCSWYRSQTAELAGSRGAAAAVG
jgi:glycosyltransferase involved in cell wall biosynthesis